MERRGLVERRECAAVGHARHHTTPLADELEPIVRRLGEWAHRNVGSQVSLRHLDARMLMWNIRRKIDREALPRHKCVVQFTLNDPPAPAASYWLVIRPGTEPDLCHTDLGFNVDLFVACELRALTSAWMGHGSFEDEIAAEGMVLVGHRVLAQTLTRWMIRSSFATAADAEPVSTCHLPPAGARQRRAGK